MARKWFVFLDYLYTFLIWGIGHWALENDMKVLFLQN